MLHLHITICIHSITLRDSERFFFEVCLLWDQPQDLRPPPCHQPLQMQCFSNRYTLHTVYLHSKSLNDPIVSSCWTVENQLNISRAPGCQLTLLQWHATHVEKTKYMFCAVSNIHTSIHYLTSHYIALRYVTLQYITLHTIYIYTPFESK